MMILNIKYGDDMKNKIEKIMNFVIYFGIALILIIIITPFIITFQSVEAHNWSGNDINYILFFKTLKNGPLHILKMTAILNNNLNVKQNDIIYCLNAHTTKNYWVQGCLVNTNIWNKYTLDIEIWENHTSILNIEKYALILNNKANLTLIIKNDSVIFYVNGQSISTKGDFGNITYTQHIEMPTSIWLEIHNINLNYTPFGNYTLIPSANETTTSNYVVNIYNNKFICYATKEYISTGYYNLTAYNICEDSYVVGNTFILKK